MDISYPNRLSFAHLPTPVQPLDRLSKELAGPRIWIKRDDLTGFGLSGNKIRKLEFVLAEALQQKADTVITCGGIQSNHCRATVLACARLGLKVHLVLRGESPTVPAGNLLIDYLGGAEVGFFSASEYDERYEKLFPALAEKYAANGRKAFLIPTGASDEIGLWGYVAATDELHRDFDRLGFEPGHIICATGSGATQAGLAVGVHLAGIQSQVTTFNVSDDAETFRQKIRGDIAKWEERYGIQANLGNLPINIIDGYVGPGYAKATPEIFDTIRRVARTEGILLDPVYTGKAFHGMLEEIKKGRFADAKDLLFIHTGGVFGLLAQAEEASST